MGVGSLEGVFGIDDASLKKSPGSAFAVKDEAFVVLEDGTVHPMREQSYRDFVKMIIENRIYSKNILEDVPDFSTNVLIKDDVSMNTVYSVHDIITEVDYTDDGELKKIVKKRISHATLASDVAVKDLWRSNPKNASMTAQALLNEILTASFTLDEYFDKDSSNIGLMSGENNASINRVVLRLRKIDNPVSEKDPSKFIHVLMTGKAAIEILGKLKSDIEALRMYSKVKINNTYTDGTSTESYVSFTTNHDELGMVFDASNTDMTCNVDPLTRTIYIQHRNFGVLESNNTQASKEAIYMTKGLLMNSNGHLVSVTRENVEVTKEINLIYYTKAQIDESILNKNTTETQDLEGILQTEELLVDGSVEIVSGLNVEGDRVLLNTVNTYVTDPIISIGSENTDNSAEFVGLNYNVYKSSENWDDNMFTGCTFEYGGGTMGMTSNVMAVVLTPESLAAYSPAYYENDEDLSNNYYIAEGILTLKASKVNMFLAMCKQDDVALAEVNANMIKLVLYTNNILNIESKYFSTHVYIEYKKLNSTKWVSLYDYALEYQYITPTSIQGVSNTYDVDKIRVRIQFRLNKKQIKALNRSVSFNVQNIGLYGAAHDGTVYTSVTTPKYANRYYGKKTDASFYRATVGGSTSRTLTPSSNTVKTISAIGIDATDDMIYSSTTGTSTSGVTIEAAFDESYFQEVTTPLKLFKLRFTMEADYITDETADNIQFRKDINATPSMQEYTIKAEFYVDKLSNMITSLGEESSVTDIFGRTTTTRIETAIRDFSITDATLLTTKTLTMTHYNTYSVIDETVGVDFSSVISALNDDVEYFKGLYKKDKLYVGVMIYLLRTPTSEPRYLNYGDNVTVTNMSCNVYDILREYRGTARDVVVTEESYNLKNMFTTSEWDNLTNILNTNSMLYLTSGINTATTSSGNGYCLEVSRNNGITYNSIGWTDPADSYEQRTYLCSFRFSKTTMNLLKVIVNLNNITVDGVKLSSFSKTVVRMGLFKYVDTKYTPLEKYIDTALIAADVISQTDLINTKTNVYGSKAMSEVTRIADFSKSYSAAYVSSIAPESHSCFYYDVNTIADGTTLELDIMIDIAFPKDQVTDATKVFFSKLAVRGVSNLEYKLNYTNELSSNQSVLYSRDSDNIVFMENKFSTDNEALYISHPTDIEAKKIIGAVDVIDGFNSDLTIKFAGDIEGSFTITDNNTEVKSIPVTVKEASETQYGLVGLNTKFSLLADADTVLEGTTYNAPSTFNVVNFMDAYHSRRSSSLELQSEEHLATSRAAKLLYEYLQNTIAKVYKKWMEQSEALRVKNTHTYDFIRFPKRDAVKRGVVAFSNVRCSINPDDDATYLCQVGSTVYKLAWSTLSLGHPWKTYNGYSTKPRDRKVVLYPVGGLDITANRMGNAATTYEWWDTDYAFGELESMTVFISSNEVNVSGTINVTLEGTDVDKYTYPLWDGHRYFDDYIVANQFYHLGGDNWFMYDSGRIGGSFVKVAGIENTYAAYDLISSKEIFNSKYIGALKKISFPLEMELTDFTEYPQYQAGRVRQSLQFAESTLEGSSKSYGAWINPDAIASLRNDYSAKDYLYGVWWTYGGGNLGIFFAGMWFTYVELILQVSTDGGTSWSTLASYTRTWSSSPVTSTGGWMTCDPAKTYRIVKNVYHRRVDDDGNPNEARRIGAFVRSIFWSPPRGSWGLGVGQYHFSGYTAQAFSRSSPLYLYRQAVVKYVTYYAEPWESAIELPYYVDLAVEGNYARDRVFIWDNKHGGHIHPKHDYYYACLINGSWAPIGLIEVADANEFTRNHYTPARYASGWDANGKPIYTFGYGTYALGCGYKAIPKGTSKLVGLMSQTITNALYQYAGQSNVTSALYVKVSLKKSTRFPTSKQDAEDIGSTVRYWTIPVVNTQTITINKWTVSDVDTDIDLDPNYYYFYYVEWGKGSDLNMSNYRGIIQKWNSLDDRYHYFNGFNLKLKYYIWKS